MSSAVPAKSKKDNKMREIFVKKVVAHVCVGEAGDAVTKAVKILQTISGQQPVISKAKHTLRNFGIRRGDNVACHVTLRGDKAMTLLGNALKVKGFSLKKTCFSNNGHFGLGISEHIDMGVKYDPQTGITGLDLMVILGRRGSRISIRKRCRAKVGPNQRITQEEAQNFFVDQLSGTLL